MPDLLIRSVVTPLEVAGDGRTVTGLVAPYGSPTEVDDGFGPYLECIDRGAFARIMERSQPRYVRLHLEHHGAWIGRGDRWLDTERGLTMQFRIDDSERGREAAYKLSDGQVPALSVGMAPGLSRQRVGSDGTVTHRITIAALHHVALVPQGAYDDALVSSVRHATAEQYTPRREALAEWIENNKT